MITKLKEQFFKDPLTPIIDKINELIDEVEKLKKCK